MLEPPLYNPSMPEFRRRLDEVMRWCAWRTRTADPVGSLRSPEFAPRPAERLAESVHRDSLESIALLRRAALERDAVPAAAPAHTQGGRLLFYDADGSLFDGAAEAESRGFLDADNAPPWDTWLGFIREPDIAGRRWCQTYVLAWIPPAFVPAVDLGIQVNPEECILWANDPKLEELVFIQRLRAADLLF